MEASSSSQVSCGELGVHWCNVRPFASISFRSRFFFEFAICFFTFSLLWRREKVEMSRFASRLSSLRLPISPWCATWRKWEFTWKSFECDVLRGKLVQVAGCSRRYIENSLSLSAMMMYWLRCTQIFSWLHHQSYPYPHTLQRPFANAAKQLFFSSPIISNGRQHNFHIDRYSFIAREMIFILQ